MSAVAVGISVDEAERITEQIVGRIDSISENVDAVMLLMREALARNAHSALGYASPGAYISDRFGNAMSGLSASLRREFVHELSEAGMSTRAIAPIFGVSKSQVATDIQVSSTGQVLPQVTPDPTVTLADLPETFEHEGITVTSSGEVIEPTVTEHTVTEKVKTVTGLDGKTYTRPEPKPERRRPLVDGARDAGWNLRKATEKLQRIHEDDRFSRNKEEVATLLRSHIQFVIETCQGFLDDIDQ